MKDIKCIDCGQDIMIYWCRHIKKENLRHAVDQDDDGAEVINDGRYWPEVECQCTIKSNMIRPRISGKTHRKICHTEFWELWGNDLIEVKDE